MIKDLKIIKIPRVSGDVWVVSWVEDQVPYREEFDNPVDARYEFRTIAEFVEEDEEDVENDL